MGGKAFVSHLPDATFPRLSPVIYASLKASLLPRLTPLFQHVGVPREAPEKQDHGDVDFIVACPRAAIGLEDIKSALGASTYIPSTQPDGRGTHNFALCLVDVLPADAAPISGEMGEAYVQVDVNIRNDVQGWENVMIFHAYGDLGMIIGRLAASVGLQVGELGLKVGFLTNFLETENLCVPGAISRPRTHIPFRFPAVVLDPGHISLLRTLIGTMGGRICDSN